MGNKLKIDLSFYAFLFFVIYFNGLSLFLSYFIALFIHEISHYLMSKGSGYMTENINIYPYGMHVSVSIDKDKKSNNFLIFLIGPIVNILLIFLIISLWWGFPIIYFYTKDFVFANFCLGVFNLIPIYPLDGGNAILYFFSSVKTRLKILKIMKVCSIFFGILFLIIFIFSCFYNPNFSCFCIAFFLLTSVFSYGEILNKSIENFSLNKVREGKIFFVNLDAKFEDFKRCFSNNYYVQFYVVDDNKRVVKILTQEDVVKIFSKKITNNIK